MSNNNSVSTGGIGIGGLLGVAFIVLKLTKVIDWPWIWVLAPFWISILFALLVFAIVILILWLVK